MSAEMWRISWRYRVSGDRYGQRNVEYVDGDIEALDLALDLMCRVEGRYDGPDGYSSTRKRFRFWTNQPQPLRRGDEKIFEYVKDVKVAQLVSNEWIDMDVEVHPPTINVTPKKLIGD